MNFSFDIKTNEDEHRGWNFQVDPSDAAWRSRAT